MTDEKNNNYNTGKQSRIAAFIIFVPILTFVSHLAITNEQYSLLYEKLWIYVLAGICFFSALSVKNKIHIYALLIGFTFVGVSLYKLMTIAGNTSGSIGLFVLTMTVAALPSLFVKALFIPTVAGYLVALLYSFILSLMNIRSTIKRTITVLLAIGFISISMLAFSPYQTQTYTDDTLRNEVLSKYGFAKQLAYAVYTGKINYVSNKTIVENNLYKDFYSLKGDTIMHGFDGAIKLKQHEDIVSITYESIPANKMCADFYYINSIDLFGFSRIEINNKPIVASGWSRETIDRAKVANCYTGEENYNITFIGSFLTMKSLMPYLFEDLIKKESEVASNDNNFSNIFDINFSQSTNIINVTKK